MSPATCQHCAMTFTRKPRSVAAYCSDRCRRQAKDERVTASLRRSNAELALLLGIPSDDYDITYEVADHRITVQGWGAVPPIVRENIIQNSQEAIPAEILALAPGDPRQALHRHLGYDPGTYCGNKYAATWPMNAFAGYSDMKGGKPSP